MMEKNYIQWIRGQVGHAPIILNFAGGCVKNRAGEVLLQKRGDREAWGLPGGAVEYGESVEETARREIREETGWDVRITRCIGIYSQYFDSYPNGDRAQTISVFFECEIIGGTEKTDGEETLALQFFDFRALPPLVNKQHADVLQDVLHGRYGVVR